MNKKTVKYLYLATAIATALNCENTIAMSGAQRQEVAVENLNEAQATVTGRFFDVLQRASEREVSIANDIRSTQMFQEWMLHDAAIRNLPVITFFARLDDAHKREAGFLIEWGMHATGMMELPDFFDDVMNLQQYGNPDRLEAARLANLLTAYVEYMEPIVANVNNH